MNNEEINLKGTYLQTEEVYQNVSTRYGGVKTCWIGGWPVRALYHEVVKLKNGKEAVNVWYRHDDERALDRFGQTYGVKTLQCDRSSNVRLTRAQAMCLPEYNGQELW